MKLDLHYVDPRLVALYDDDNPRGADTDFYVGLAAELRAECIVDLGCGSGLLTRELALPGRRIIGVDPSAPMLTWARDQPGAEQVKWVEGDAAAIGTPDADLAIMTGNVAQVFLEDTGWSSALCHLHAALRPGGTLAFEARNPDYREWESWHRRATFEQVDTPSGPMETWLDVTRVEDGCVHMVGHNVFLETGEDLVVDSTLRFRTQAQLTDSLRAAGFTVMQAYGDWQLGPVSRDSRVMVFVALRH